MYRVDVRDAVERVRLFRFLFPLPGGACLSVVAVAAAPALEAGIIPIYL